MSLEFAGSRNNMASSQKKTGLMKIVLSILQAAVVVTWQVVV
jgi:hypothetical protein